MSTPRSKPLVIPGRKLNEKFVHFVSNVLTEIECNEWIAFAEKAGFQPASLLTDQKTKNPHRNNDRVLVLDATRSKLLYERLQGFLPSTWKSAGQDWKLAGLNDRLSFLRYQNSEHYGRHVDVPYEDSKNGIQSFITIQLYLNQGFVGGETRFTQEVGYKDFSQRQHLDVIPQTGSVLLFEHELEHEGCAVTKGTKYTVRIDVLYSKPK